MKFYCMACKKHIYNFIGQFVADTPIRSIDFIPAKKSIPQPLPATKATCPLCGCKLDFTPLAFIKEQK